MESNIQKLKIIGFLKGASFFTPILTLYLLGHNISLQDIVLTQTIYAIFIFFGEVPTGILADKFGQKFSITTGYILNALTYIVLILNPTVFGMYLAYAVRGLADSFLSGSEESLFYESFKNQKSLTGNYNKHYSIFNSNMMIGVVVSTLFAGLLVQQLGESSYIPLFLLNMVSMLLAFVIALTINDVRAEIRDKAMGTKSMKILKEALTLIKNNPSINALVWVSVLTLSGEFFLYSVYQPYFEANLVPAFFLGAVLSIGALLNFIILRYAYLLEKSFSFGKIILYSNLVLAVLYIGLALILHPIFLVVGVIFLRSLFNIQLPIISDYVNQYIPSEIRTTVLSGMSQIKYLVQIVVRTILAILVGAIGIQNTFLIQGIYLLIGSLLAFWILTKCGCINKITEHKEEI